MKTHAAFNELSISCEQPQSEAEAIELLERMVATIAKLKKLGFSTLRVNDSFLQQQVLAGLTIHAVILKLQKDARVIWYKALSSPHASVDDDAILQIKVLRIEGSEFEYPEGVVYALVDGTLAVSFDKPFWRISNLSVDVVNESTKTTSNYDLPHASAEIHVMEHVVFASRVTTSIEFHLSPKVSNPLPNTSMSNLLANPTWDAFYDELSSMVVQQKTARLTEMAKQVAYVNGYQFSSDLSSLNQRRFGSLRQIFKSEFVRGRETVYLSTDFENSAGAFEVCDHKGQHRGEWMFSGSMNKHPQHKHDIILTNS